MKSYEIRQKFLDFFKDNGHKILPGSSLIPDDPTLLLTVAGMVQFKKIFLGLEPAKFTKVATVQRCVRTNDLENVGHTARHHTFFEMLGNFSFGDYFKQDAVAYAWELLTKNFGLNKDKLWIAVYEKDEETYNIWTNKINIPKEKIVKLGEDNNFWAAGPTGPCGPCSEIYFDLGEKYGCGKNNCMPGCECDRFLEIWNLVFMEFNRDESGTLLPLPKKNIDTGMGLERIASVLQNVKTNFDTDLFLPIIERIKQLSNIDDKKKFIVSSRIIADHIRAASFLAFDGLVPGNEGRNYVLRRLIRRAILHAKNLNLESPFINKITPVIAQIMQISYPDFASSIDSINKVLNNEEIMFEKTLDKGLEMLKDIISKSRNGVISGQDAFKLYDTYGFPVEMTKEIALERGYSVDLDGFKEALQQQQEKSKQSSKKFVMAAIPQVENYPKTEFVGYDTLESESVVLGIVENYLIVDKTPFYTESGGQDSDKGWVIIDKNKYEVERVAKTANKVTLHKINFDIYPKVGEKVKVVVNEQIRKMIAAHHTSTHLLHAALHKIIGPQALQKGSFVGSDKFRLDFSCSRALTDEEINKIEDFVNTAIKNSLAVKTYITTFENAKKIGAIALFDEKYGDEVRVVEIEGISRELCGGTHVKNTSEIGLFKIIRESAIAQGIRRIEAVSGENAEEYIAQLMMEEIKKKELEELKKKAKEEEKRQEKEIKNVPVYQEDIGKIKFFFFSNDNFSPKIVGPYLRDLVARYTNAIAVAVTGNSIMISSKNYSDIKLDSSKILKKIFELYPGKGGGRVDFAQGSFLDIKTIDKNEFLKRLKQIISEVLVL